MRPFDQYGNLALPTYAEEGGLRRSTVRGAGATLSASGLTLVLQLGGTVVLARLLTPADFGLVAMVTTFSLLLVNFGFNGFTEAIVQREEISRQLASNIFWINISFRSTAADFRLCGIWLSSGAAFSILPAVRAGRRRRLSHHPYHQLFYCSPGPAEAVDALHGSFTQRYLRACRSGGHFDPAGLDGVGILGTVAGAITGVPVSSGIGAFFMCHWIPSRPRREEGTGSTVRFALHTYGNFVVNYMSRNTDNLLVGWRFDAQSLGFYKKAYDLFALSASQLTSTISVVVDMPA